MSLWLATALDSLQLTLPAEPGRVLRDAARAQLAAGLRIKRLTLEVVDALGTVGVTPVLLKGYGLASRLFPAQPLCRPSTDVDILVPPYQLGPVTEALLRLGFQQVADEGLADVFEEHHHLSFVRPGGLVEVHFRAFSGFGGGSFDSSALFSRVHAGSLDGRAVSWLAPSDEFAYLATHAANHGFLRASWLLDLVRFLTVYPGLSWAEMARASRQAGFFEPISVSLWILREKLGVSLPPEAARQFRLDRQRRLLDRLVFSASRLEGAALSAHRVGSFVLRLWLVDSPQHGLRHLSEGARRLARRLRARR